MKAKQTGKCGKSDGNKSKKTDCFLIFVSQKLGQNHFSRLSHDLHKSKSGSNQQSTHEKTLDHQHHHRLTLVSNSEVN
ncbi:CLUMA_CG019729, isoform A [Clunio marinus]|uniref:CLUMA_CG019729, isoform A n=1 Tax=Clunio marinus TaxID=568069 RepID=A0A1J1J4N6_9DIPT|nr:CLUMA_CG019729, isoform A [Clunio marinus]